MPGRDASVCRSEGDGATCDAPRNVMRYDGPIDPNRLAFVGIEGYCACVRATSTSFAPIDWGPSESLWRAIRRPGHAYREPLPAVRCELTPR